MTLTPQHNGEIGWLFDGNTALLGEIVGRDDIVDVVARISIDGFSPKGPRRLRWSVVSDADIPLGAGEAWSFDDAVVKVYRAMGWRPRC